jgi:KUP system potassium uptake protein
MKTTNISKLSVWGVIITLGIVFGDIATSPLYVLRAIVNWSGGVSEDIILGALSCIIWTLTLQTTIKYVFIVLKADNKGEGGILALYALVRRHSRWVFILAIIGACMLLADGIITPAITVVSAIEGLKLINNNIPIIPIVLIIITGLFFIQQFGTNSLGKFFGPIMIIWFLMLSILGFFWVSQNLIVLKAFNPYYGYQLLINNKAGFLLLGAVFLCTTGAEALYSDLGHCGIKNIRVSWIFVKTALILNYLGQGAWLLLHPNITNETNSFFEIMPSWFLLTGIVISTAAAIIASQALISGSFSIINQAILLNFWPRVKISHPTFNKGQIYIPSINKLLYVGCVIVILYFKESHNMEAAYGLAITITEIMTTLLMSFYFLIKRKSLWIVLGFISIYSIIEVSFFIANMFKFINGGWVTLLIAVILFYIMFIWYKGRTIKKRLTDYVDIDKYFAMLTDMKKDETISKYSTNLVYFTHATSVHEIESKVIFSIFNKQPKRADVYWLVHVEVVDEPHTMTYKVSHLIPETLIRVDFKIGFKVPTKINLYFRKVIEELVINKEVDITTRYPSLHKYAVSGDFRFILTDRVQGYDFDFKPFNQFVMDSYDILKKIGMPEEKAYGLDTSCVVTEKIPLVINKGIDFSLTRIKE